MDRVVLIADGWTDLPIACEFLLDVIAMNAEAASQALREAEQSVERRRQDLARAEDAVRCTPGLAERCRQELLAARPHLRRDADLAAEHPILLAGLQSLRQHYHDAFEQWVRERLDVPSSWHAKQAELALLEYVDLCLGSGSPIRERLVARLQREKQCSSTARQLVQQAIDAVDDDRPPGARGLAIQGPHAEARSVIRARLETLRSATRGSAVDRRSEVEAAARRALQRLDDGVKSAERLLQTAELAKERLAELEAEVAALMAPHVARETAAEQAALEAAERRLEEARAALVASAATDLLFDLSSLGERPPAGLRERIELARADTLRRWGAAHGIPLDDQQVAALASMHEHTLVTARAGSGKTRTLVARAACLVNHCGVAPTDVMLLAFNKDAAREMRERLEQFGAPCPHVMTFHALAHALVHPEEAILYDDEEAGNYSHTREMQRIINHFLQEPAWRDRVKALMLDHFREDWEALFEKVTVGTTADILAFRRSIVTETLRGDYVKSRGEQVIGNFLFEHDVPYLYERNHWWNRRNYRPDFTLDGPKIVIEYFGLTGQPGYDKQVEEKREYWANQREWKFLEYGPNALRAKGEEGLASRLHADLQRLGVPLRRLSEQQLWDRIEDRTLTKFAGLLRTFVGRCRKTGLSPAGLSERLREYAGEDLEHRFLHIAAEAFRVYVQRLGQEGLEDFDGLMARAAELIEAGTTAFDRKSGAGDLAHLRFMMMDEFQDMSPLFVRVLEGVRRLNPAVIVFGVGDGWQAINAFAGSDLRYFHGFAERFPPAKRLSLSTNYRSAQRVVQLGNGVMTGKGEPARWRADAPPGRVLVADLKQLVPAAEEASGWPGEQITPAVRRLLRATLADGKRVAILSRRDGVPYFVALDKDDAKKAGKLESLQRRWTAGLSKAEQDSVTVSTAHSYKGQEADVVIVLDALERSYPLIHPFWMFTRVFGDSLEKIVEDERRLFYVACTRARETLYLVTDEGRESEFLKQIWPLCKPLVWSQYPPLVRGRRGWLMKVGSQRGLGSAPTFERKELLKADGFTFYDGDWQHWCKALPASLTGPEVADRIRRAAWLPGPDGLEVRLCTGDGTVVETFAVIGGALELPDDR